MIELPTICQTAIVAAISLGAVSYLIRQWRQGTSSDSHTGCDRCGLNQ